MDYPSIRLLTDALVADGDTVICTGTMEAKQKTGEPYFAWTVDVYRFARGKIVEMMSYITEKKG